MAVAKKQQKYYRVVATVGAVSKEYWTWAYSEAQAMRFAARRLNKARGMVPWAWIDDLQAEEENPPPRKSAA